jgi:SagB-type dehydrogenase family enzyme
MLLAQDINLPTPVKTGGKPLMQALSERKSIRSYQDKSLSDQTLSNLLWAANGFNRPDKRTAPTANNRQELDLYVALKSGIYLYDAQNNRLKLIRKGDFRKNTGVQDFVATAAANIIFVSDLGEASSEQYAFTDCGFVAQNIYLYCASEGLGSVVRGSFNKDELAKLLNLTGKMQVLLTQSVGYPK